MSETMDYEWDVMVDLETLGTNSRAPILSIGAVLFQLEEPTGAAQFFYANVDLQSCLDVGLKPDARAFYWWLEQSEQARQRLTDPPPYQLGDVLVELSRWLPSDESFRLWAHGANFDPGILESAYTATGLATPWKYNAVRDTRTLYHAVGLDWDAAFEALIRLDAHDALADARAQATMVRQAWAMRGNVRTPEGVPA